MVRLGCGFELAQCLPFLEVGARLGAQHILVMGDDAEEGRITAQFARLCDAAAPAPATVEGLIHDARCARLPPGEGGIALHDLFARLPADLPVSIEIPNEVRALAMGYEAWARAALAHTRRVLEGEP